MEIAGHAIQIARHPRRLAFKLFELLPQGFRLWRHGIPKRPHFPGPKTKPLGEVVMELAGDSSSLRFLH
jgi:hypothetical protein